jgi:hypothetical protein
MAIGLGLGVGIGDLVALEALLLALPALQVLNRRIVAAHRRKDNRNTAADRPVRAIRCPA